MEASVDVGGRDTAPVVPAPSAAVKYGRTDSLFAAMETNAAVRAKQADMLVGALREGRGPGGARR